MPYNEQGEWIEVPGEAPPSGFQRTWDQLTGRNKPAPPPALGPSPEEVASAQKIASNEEAKKKKDEEEARTKKDADTASSQAVAELAKTEAETARLEALAAAANSPTEKAKAEAELAVAQARLTQIQAEMEREARQMSPEALARLTSELVAAREAAGRTAAAEESAKTRAATAAESALDRAARAGEQAANLGARRDESNQAAGISIRGQEIERLKSQDDWVLGLLRQQVAEGTLSLDKASKQFDAYVSRARLPSEIMKNVSSAMEPLIPYLTSAKKGDSAPGFEQGGPLQAMIERSGGKYDPKAYAINPVKVDMFGLAKKAGADFTKTSVPDPAKHFAGITVPQTDPNRVSALANAPAAPALLPGLPGSAPPAAAPAQSIPETMVPAAPSYAPTEDEMQKMQILLNGG